MLVIVYIVDILEASMQDSAYKSMSFHPLATDSVKPIVNFLSVTFPNPEALFTMSCIPQVVTVPSMLHTHTLTHV